MKWSEYKVEIVTHCISSGADQQRAELRVPSIRGQIRWWFRALEGTKEEEKSIFGGIHNGAKKSSVVFHVGDPSLDYKLRNLHDLFGRNPNDPKAYLLWPLRPTEQNDQKRGMFLAGTTFIVRYGIRQYASDKSSGYIDEILSSKLQTAIEAWLLLGAIGTRSRRGFGSLMIQPDAVATEHSIDSFKERIRVVLSTFGHPPIMVMAIKSAVQNEIEALVSLGEWLKKWRGGIIRPGVTPSKWGKNDHDAALNKKGVLYRPVLGLPITQRYTGRSIRIDTKPANSNRWASPVHLKVLKWGGKYYPLAVFFPHMAIPQDYAVKLSEGRNSDFTIPVDQELFLEMMKPAADSIVLWKPGI